MKYGKGVGGQELCQFYSVNYVWIFKPSVTEFSRNKVCIQFFFVCSLFHSSVAFLTLIIT